MKSHAHLALLAAVIAIFALVLWLLFGGDLAHGRNDGAPREPTATDVGASAPATSDREPASLVDPSSRDLPESAADSSAPAPRSLDARPPASSSAARIVFRYDSGAPAAGLQLRRADDAKGTRLEHRSPYWKLHLDEHGTLDLANARTLGSIVAVRLGDHVVAVLPFDPEHVREYELATLIDQQFVLQGVPGGRDGALVLSLYSDALSNFPGASEVTHGLAPGGFADTWSVYAKVYAKAVSTPLTPFVLTRYQLELSRDKPSVRVRLPRGALHVERLKSPAGWSAAITGDLVVDGRTIAIPVRALPLVAARLARDEQGDPIVPRSVRLISAMIARDGNAASSGEQELAFEVDGDVLTVGLDHRERDEQGVTYALAFYWDDGAMTSTGAGDWDALTKPIEFGPEREPWQR